MSNYRLLPNGKLDDNNLHSEYERGYVDCFNKYYMEIWQDQMINSFVTGEFELIPSVYNKFKEVDH